METSYLKTLELDKIIARAAEGCVCKEAREMLLATQPQCDPDEVRYALEQTDAINTLLIKNGSPRFGGVENVSQLAARAVKGGVLSMGELLMVAGALRNFQNLSSWYGASEHDALPTDDLFYALRGLHAPPFHSIPPPSWSAAAALSGSERILHRQSWTGRPCWCPALPRMPWHRCGRHCGRAVHTHSWSWSSNFIRYSTARRSRIVYLCTVSRNLPATRCPMSGM